jgi:hypothetical protein
MRVPPLLLTLPILALAACAAAPPSPSPSPGAAAPAPKMPDRYTIILTPQAMELLLDVVAKSDAPHAAEVAPVQSEIGRQVQEQIKAAQAPKPAE